MNENDEMIERLLSVAPLRPQDTGFTQRVLLALPPRARFGAGSRGSFALASRAGLALGLLVAAQRWYYMGACDADTVVAILLFIAPTFAAASKLCGPMISYSRLVGLWRGASHWR